MALREKALTVIMLALVFLSLTMAPTWSMALLILFGMVAPAVVAAGRKMRRNLESSSTSSSSSGIKYDVFLSARGQDSCKGFTDHLYCKLIDAGIRVFKDDEHPPQGEQIGPELKEAIKQSRISIAVLSKGYASSKICLNELVQMWECRNSDGQSLIPIFYDISPSDVKRQAGYFRTSFNRHVIDGVDSNTIKTWKEVFRQIGRLRGWENLNRGHESHLVKEVVARVVQVLKKDDQVVTEELVGIDHHVQEMMGKLGVVFSEGQAIEVRGDDVGVVGICGMLGVGKTTLAKAVFNKIHMLFDACSFLGGISSERLLLSQQMLIADLQLQKPAPLKSSSEGIGNIGSLFSNAKVLIVLDDVDDDEQIKALAGKLTWFGPGSRIIVTTDKRNVLNAFDVGAAGQTVKEYELETMGHDHALRLFRKHVFLGDAPQDVSEYDSLSIDIVKAIGGLPLAIVDHASYLRDKTKDIDVWRSTLELLNKHPEDRV